MKIKVFLVFSLFSISFFLPRTSVFAQTQSPCSGTVSITDTSQVEQGTMFVIANSSQAKFTITGPANYQANSPAWFQQNIPAGTYTITWGPVTGCAIPPSEIKSTDARGSVSFAGNYKDLTPPKQYGRIEVGTNLNQLTTINVSGPDIRTVQGTSFSWLTAPVGTYTVTYGDVEGYVTPPSETQTLIVGGYLNFYGTYKVKSGHFMTIQSAPSADAYINDKFIGKTPIKTKLPVGVPIRIRCSAIGYENYEYNYPALSPLAPGEAVSSDWTCLMRAKKNSGGQAASNTGTIIVKVSPIREADFRITGPENKTLSRATSLTWPNAPTGTYTVTYGSTPEEGFVIPPSETKTLKAGETLLFEGVYTSTKEGRSAPQEVSSQDIAVSPPQKPQGFFSRFLQNISSFFKKLFFRSRPVPAVQQPIVPKEEEVVPERTPTLPVPIQR